MKEEEHFLFIHFIELLVDKNKTFVIIRINCSLAEPDIWG